jgi:putative membrane protein
MKEFYIKNHIIRALIGSLFIVVLDILIEPVAIKYDYWSWIDSEVPFQNYVGWFIFSFLLLRFFFQMKFRKHNVAAIVLFVVQLVFFLLLNQKSL